MIDHKGRAWTISLHHDAETVPPFEGAFAQHRLDHIQRKREAIRFFRIDVKPHICRLGQKREGTKTRHQFFHHAVALRHFIARMERGEFDGNTWIFTAVRGMTRLCNGRNRTAVGQVIPFGIGVGFRRLAQHVIGI